MIDHRIGFRSSQAELLETIDDHLGTGLRGEDATLVFDVNVGSHGTVHLLADEEWDFPDLDMFLGQLVSILNEYAGWTHSCAVIHAGAVRSPEGEVVLLAGPSGRGKSTLTAAFIGEGWDYLGDEAIGVRPGSCIAVAYPKQLAVDLAGLGALGVSPPNPGERPGTRSGDSFIRAAELRRGVVSLSGDVGPISRVFLPEFSEGSEARLEDLTAAGAIIELLASTLNLARAGQSGLDAVCGLAASVPIQRLRYGDAPSAITAIGEHKSAPRA